MSAELPFAVGAIAFGQRYVAWSKLLIRTLRRYGGFDGAVHLVTDRPDAYRGLPGVHPIQARADDATAAKLYKTQILDWVPGDRVVYLDVDVLVGRPLLPWWQAIDGFWERRQLAAFPEPRLEGEPYHSGVLAIDRVASAPLLARWESALQTRHRRDQPALAEAVGTRDEVMLMPKEHLRFLHRRLCKNPARATFVHVTFTGSQAWLPPWRVARYLRTAFDLRELPFAAGDNARWYWKNLSRGNLLRWAARRAARRLGLLKSRREAA